MEMIVKKEEYLIYSFREFKDPECGLRIDLNSLDEKGYYHGYTILGSSVIEVRVPGREELIFPDIEHLYFAAINPSFPELLGRIKKDKIDDLALLYITLRHTRNRCIPIRDEKRFMDYVIRNKVSLQWIERITGCDATHPRVQSLVKEKLAHCYTKDSLLEIEKEVEKADLLVEYSRRCEELGIETDMYKEFNAVNPF